MSLFQAGLKKGAFFGFKAWKKHYELVPLIGFISFACALGAGFMGYALLTKPDVRVLKSDTPPWENVKGNEVRKLYATHKDKYQAIPELEQLRKEIGSYKY